MTSVARANRQFEVFLEGWTMADDPRVNHPGVLRKEWREGPQKGKVTYYAVGPSRETEEEALADFQSFRYCEARDADLRELAGAVELQATLSEIKPLAALAIRLWTADLQTETGDILTELRDAVEGLSDEARAELTEGSKDR